MQKKQQHLTTICVSSLDVSMDSRWINGLSRNETSLPFTSFANSAFQKVRAKTHKSGNQPLVMSRRALMYP